MRLVAHAFRSWPVGHPSMRHFSPATVIIGVTCLLGVFLGWALAAARWFYVILVIVLASVAFFLRWPVVCTFGLYAFLLPFGTVGATQGMGFTRPVSVITA